MLNWRTPTGEICHERLTHVCRSWQAVVSATLAADDDLTCTPVDVTQLQTGHLGCP